MLYIDIHTHKKKSKKASIVNCLSHFSQLPESSGFYSVGIHPWYITEETEKQFLELCNLGEHTHVLAIGECGLDKVCETNFVWQKQYFIKQIQVAQNLHKPLIIHCVKAYQEVMLILEEQKVQVPVIFHGFNKKNQALAQTLISKGYYLSFGKPLLNSAVGNTFKSIPIEKIFLETDDSDVDIEALYQVAANLKAMDLATLAEQLTQNAALVFNVNFNLYDE